MQLSGLLVLSSRFIPTVVNILRKIVDEGQTQQQTPQHSQLYPSMSSQNFQSQTLRQAAVSDSLPASCSSSTISSNSDIEHWRFLNRRETGGYWLKSPVCLIPWSCMRNLMFFFPCGSCLLGMKRGTSQFPPVIKLTISLSFDYLFFRVYPFRLKIMRMTFLFPSHIKYSVNYQYTVFKLQQFSSISVWNLS